MAPRNPIATTSPTVAAFDILAGKSFVLFHGDCRELLRELPAASVRLIVSSPPYFMGKEYDRSKRYEDFEREHRELVPLLSRILRPGGSICWQVGMHAENGKIV